MLGDAFPALFEELRRVALLSNTLPRQLHFLLATPTAVDGDEEERRYVQALFALKERSLQLLEASSASVALELMEIARQRRRHLVQDVRNGHVFDRLHGQASKVQELEKALLGPDGKRANELDASSI